MAEKSEAQMLVDRLLAVRNKLAASALGLEKTMVSIRGEARTADRPPAAPKVPLTETRFLPAIELLAVELEHVAERLAIDLEELGSRF